MEFGFPKLMGVLNVTPDSFSDGGKHVKLDAALNQAKFMEENGVDIIDIGGESTRPGALTVPISEEIKRIEPVINGISARSKIPISVDTRKSDVASAACKAGASMVNDVSGFTFDPNLLAYCSKNKLPVRRQIHQLGETSVKKPRFQRKMHETSTTSTQKSKKPPLR